MNSKRYDFFISYKVENALIARFISEQLMASGANVWLDEYKITSLTNESLQNIIETAIKNSEWGIVFTNKSYYQSEVCAKELSMIKYCLGHNKIINIQLGGDSNSGEFLPELTCEYTYNRRNRSSMLDFIRKATNRKITRYGTIQNSGQYWYEGDLLQNPFFLDVTGWEEDGFKLKRVFNNSELHMSLNMCAHPDPQIASRLIMRTLDHRKLLNELLETGTSFFIENNLECMGVHLVPHHEFIHNSFTCRVNDNHYERFYHVSLPKPNSDQVGLFIFVFSFCGSFKDFISVSWAMDDIVTSLEWPRGKQNDATTNINRAFTYVNLRRFDEAVAILEETAKEYPDYPDAYNELAFIYGKVRGDLPRAAKYADIATKCDPNNPKFLNTLYRIQLDLLKRQVMVKESISDLEQFVKNLDEVIRRFEDYPGLYMTKALALALGGKPKNIWFEQLIIAKNKYKERNAMASGVYLDLSGVESVIKKMEIDCENIAKELNTRGATY